MTSFGPKGGQQTSFATTFVDFCILLSCYLCCFKMKHPQRCFKHVCLLSAQFKTVGPEAKPEPVPEARASKKREAGRLSFVCGIGKYGMTMKHEEMGKGKL